MSVTIAFQFRGSDHIQQSPHFQRRHPPYGSRSDQQRALPQHHARWYVILLSVGVGARCSPSSTCQLPSCSNTTHLHWKVLSDLTDILDGATQTSWKRLQSFTRPCLRLQPSSVAQNSTFLVKRLDTIVGQRPRLPRQLEHTPVARTQEPTSRPCPDAPQTPLVSGKAKQIPAAVLQSPMITNASRVPDVMGKFPRRNTPGPTHRCRDPHEHEDHRNQMRTMVEKMPQALPQIAGRGLNCSGVEHWLSDSLQLWRAGSTQI